MLDANVFAAALSPADIYFIDSLALLAEIRPELLLDVCPTLVLPECIGAIVRPAGRVLLAQRVLAGGKPIRGTSLGTRAHGL